MKCNDTSKLIIDQLAGELSPKQANRLKKHLAACDACRKESEMLNKVWERSDETLKADSFAEELTPNRRAEIFAVAQHEEKRRYSSGIITRVVEYLAVIMICIVLAGMLLPSLNQSREKARMISQKSIEKQRKLEAMMAEMEAEEADSSGRIAEDKGERGTAIHLVRTPPIEKSKKRIAKSDWKMSPAPAGKPKSASPPARQSYFSMARSKLAGVTNTLGGEKDEITKETKSTITVKRNVSASGPLPLTQNLRVAPALKRLEKKRIASKSEDAFVETREIPAPSQEGYAKKIYKNNRKDPEIKLSYEVTTVDDTELTLKKNQLAKLKHSYPEDNPKVKKLETEIIELRKKAIIDSKKRYGLSDNASSVYGNVLYSKGKITPKKVIGATSCSVETKPISSDPIHSLRMLEMKIAKKRKRGEKLNKQDMKEIKRLTSIIAGSEACSINPPLCFKLNLKLWNMTTAENVKAYLKENGYPVPRHVKVNKRTNQIFIVVPESQNKKFKDLFKKLQEEEKELKDLSKGLPFIKCQSRPVSTFSIDTDTASYIQARKSIRRGERPDPLKIRPEEFINYFDYNYRSPVNTTFAVYPEAAPSPFRPNNTLFRIGIQGKRLGPGVNTSTHYTILLDTSGSMAVKDRMGLAKKALVMLLKKIKSSDYISLLLCGNKTNVVFRMRALSPENRQRLLRILNRVTPHSVADFANGISKAYAFADRYYLRNSSNRIIIISDGIFELNADGRKNITKQIEAARKRGISNIVIGLGGDGDDSMLEKVAATGDGSYVFLDTEREAEELFTTQFEARFREIARDVKIQVQFNPEAVKSYRQIGYKNRQLSKADFRNDKVDAGEVGSGQSVTALYELNLKDGIAEDTVVATVRIRYKKAGDMSVEEKAFSLYESDIKKKFETASPNFKLAAFVAEFAESLRYPETQNIASLRGVADQLNSVWMKHYKKDYKVTELLSLIKRAK